MIPIFSLKLNNKLEYETCSDDACLCMIRICWTWLKKNFKYHHSFPGFQMTGREDAVSSCRARLRVRVNLTNSNHVNPSQHSFSTHHPNLHRSWCRRLRCPYEEAPALYWCHLLRQPSWVRFHIPFSSFFSSKFNNEIERGCIKREKHNILPSPSTQNHTSPINMKNKSN